MTTVQTADVDGRTYIDGNQPGFRHVNSSGVQSLIKSNLSAIVDPGATDDSGAGYSVGSTWINATSDSVFICTDVSVGTANWKNTTSVSVPAGIGAELQYRLSATEFGAIPNSSWNGSSLILGSSLLFSPDATYNIGGSNSNRISSIFLTHACKIRSDNSASGFFLHNADGTFGYVAISTGTGLQLIDFNTYLFGTSLTSTITESISFYRSREGGSVVSGDVLGELNFFGQASGDILSAKIKVVIEGTVAATRVPSKIVFAVGTDAAPTVLTDRLTIDSSGLSAFSGTVSISKAAASFEILAKITDSATGKGFWFRPIEGHIAAAASGTPLHIRTWNDAYLDITEGTGITFAPAAASSADGRYTSGKLFGIGTVDPSAKLHVVSSITTTVTGCYEAINSQSVSILQLNHGDTPGGGANFISCTSFGGTEGDKLEIDYLGRIRNSAVFGGMIVLDAAGYGYVAICTAVNPTVPFVVLGQDLFNTGTGIGLRNDGGINWSSLGDALGSKDLHLFRGGAATLQIGGGGGVAIHQTFKSGDGSGENIVASNLKIAPGKSTGNAIPASVIIQGTVAGTGGTALQMLNDVVTITGTLCTFSSNIQFGTHSALTAETVTGYITIKDSGGVDRKLAVVS